MLGARPSKPCSPLHPGGQPLNVLLIVPIRPAASWIARLLEANGHRPAAIRRLEEIVRVASFIRFDAIVTWLPQQELSALCKIVEQWPFVIPTIVLSWSPSWNHAPASSGRHLVLPLPITGPDLLGALAACSLITQWPSAASNIAEPPRRDLAGSRSSRHGTNGS